MTIIQDLQRIARKGPPGPPPRPGLVWHEETSRWRRPKNVSDEVSQVSQVEPSGTVKPPKHGVDWAAFNVAYTKEEVQAINSYVGDDYFSINGYLRHGIETIEGIVSDDETRGIRDDIERNIGLMKSAMDKQYLNSNLIVHRGMGSSIPPSAFEPGNIIEDKAFVSTSVRKNIAGDFVGGKIQLKIKIPKGTHFLFGKEVEEEVILPAGSRFKVLQRTAIPIPKRSLTPVQRRRLTGRYLVSMELINE